jgi:hypothetical protein
VVATAARRGRERPAATLSVSQRARDVPDGCWRWRRWRSSNSWLLLGGEKKVCLCSILFIFINLSSCPQPPALCRPLSHINQLKVGEDAGAITLVNALARWASTRAISSAFLPSARSPCLFSASLISGTFNFFTPNASALMSATSTFSSFNAFTFALFSVWRTFSSFTFFNTSSVGLI